MPIKKIRLNPTELFKASLDKKLLKTLLFNHSPELILFVGEKENKLKYERYNELRSKVKQAVKSQKFDYASKLRTDERKFLYRFVSSMKKKTCLFDDIHISDLNTNYKVCWQLIELLFE